MGIAHHTSYVVYMEAARVEWLRRRGITYGGFVEQGLHLPVVELSVAYRSPARFDDELDVETSLAEIGAASLRFDYRIVRVEGGTLCAEGSTRLACIDHRGGLRRLSADLLAVLERPETR
jgi:acyl-CoA thioester hydrolase